MATANLYVRLEISGEDYGVGSLTSPIAITVTGDRHDVDVTLAAQGSAGDLKVLWDSTNFPVTSFDIGYFVCDQDCILQFQTSGSTNQDYFAFQIEGNVPTLLSSLIGEILDNSGVRIETDAGAVATTDAIIEISVKNAVASAATARLVLID